MVVGPTLLSSASPTIPHFVSEAAASGIDHVYAGDFDYSVGGGVAAFDCNGDGTPDLYFAGGSEPAALYRNDSPVGGALRFTATARSADRSRRGHRRLPDRHRWRRHQPTWSCCASARTCCCAGLGDCRFERANEALGLRRRQRLVDGVQRDVGGAARACRRSPSATTSTVDAAASRPTTAPTTRSSGRTPTAAATPRRSPLTPGLLHAVDALQRLGPLRPSATCGSATTATTTRLGGEEQLWRIAPGEAAPALHRRGRLGSRCRSGAWASPATTSPGDGYPDYLPDQPGRQQAADAGSPGPGQPTYRDIALARASPPRGRSPAAPRCPRPPGTPNSQDVNNDGLIDLFVSKGNVEAAGRLRAAGSQRPVPRPGGRDVREARRRGRHRPTSTAVAARPWSTSTSTACSTWSRSTARTPVELWRNVGSGDRRRSRSDGPLARAAAHDAGANRDAIGAWIEVRAGRAGRQRAR